MSATLRNLEFRGFPAAQKSRSRFVGCVLPILVTAAAFAQDAAKPAPEPSAAQPQEVDAVSSAKFRALAKLARQTSVVVLKNSGEAPAQLRPEPLLKYGDDDRKIKESTLWLWTDGDQPVVLQKIEVNVWNAAAPSWTFCVATLTDQPLRISWPFRDEPFETKPLQFLTLSDAQPPAVDATSFALQLDVLAGEFSVTETVSKQQHSLLALPAPLHQFSTPDDPRGAIFTFRFGENPDVHLVLRSVADSSGTRIWQAGAARLTADLVRVTRGDQEVLPPTGAKPGYHQNWAYFFTSVKVDPDAP